MVASTIFKMAVKAAAPKASKAVSQANETANVLKSLGTESDTLVDKKVLNKIETRKGIPLEYGDIGESLDKARKFNIIAEEQIKKYNIDPDSIIKNEEGLPAVLYHKYSGGDKPFKLGKSKGNPEYREKELSKEIGEDVSFTNAPDNNDFLSTTTVPPSTNKFGSNFDNAATFIGIGKVKKVFEHTDEKQVDELLKPFKESKNYNKLKENIQKGDWKFIELERIKDRLKELGYDAFTTSEYGKNVMLFNPKEQFIPLFNPLNKTDETASILKTLGKKESDISDFHSKYFRGDDKTRYRSEDLQKEAMKLDEGLISLDDFIKARDKIKPLKTYGTVPPLNKQTDEAGNLIAPDVFDPMEIIGPMGKNKIDATGIIGVNKTIKEGERATSRFDLPAYNRYDRYIPVIQTLVDKVNKATGKIKKQFVKKGFSPTVVLTDVNFNYSPKQSFDIAKGLRGLSSDGKEYSLGKGIKLKKGDKKLGEKQPFATIEGNWKDLTPEEAYKYANEKIGTKEWTEVGFDPAARLSFYNRATGEPVFNAEEVIQVGAMILARGIKKPTKKQLEKLNIKTKAGEVIRYKEGGQVMPMQYGGGLSNAYSTLSERRQNQNMYGMGDVPMEQMPSQMSSAFQDPMEASAFSPVNMEHGGDIVVPKERMINDQPHELSYINPQEAGLLKALGGSGRRVDGIPAYFWSSDEGDGTGSDAYQDLGSLADEMDQADMDAGAASLNLDGDYRDGGYVSLDSLGNEIVIDSDLDRAINEVNLRNAATLGGQAYRDRFDSLGKIDPRSQFNNLDVFQRGIDRDLYQKAGIPLANLLEQKGLATFGKGMRGPLEAYTPGDALYRNLEDVPEDSKRGEYDPEALVGNADLSNNPNKAAIQAFNNGLRYSKSGDTIADVTQSMKDSGRFSDAEISSAAATMGYSPNSSTQASQVYDSLNDSRMSGALQGLTLMAGGLASPTSIITAIGQSYGDRGETRDPYSDVGDVIGKLTDKATDTLGVNVGKIGDAVAIVNNPIGYLGSKIDPSRRGVLNRGTIEDLKAQQARQADIAYNSPSRRMVAPVQDTINYLDSGDVSLGSLAPDPREAPEQNMFEEGISSIVDFFGGPEAAYRNNIDTSFGSGNDQPDRRRVVQAAVPTPSPVKEDEELTGIKGLLARRKPAASRRDSNKFSELLLSSLYPNQNINLG